MSRTLLPYHADDLSALARALKRELDAREKRPGHVEWLNILVRATGYRNFQHYKAEAGALPSRPDTPAMPLAHAMPEPEAVDLKRVEAVARCFDHKGVLTAGRPRPTTSISASGGSGAHSRRARPDGARGQRLPQGAQRFRRSRAAAPGDGQCQADRPGSRLPPLSPHRAAPPAEALAVIRARPALVA